MADPIIFVPGEESARLRELIARLGLADTIELHGAVTQEELRTWYRQATLFALPCLITESGDRDGIPNVLAEAMASGVAIVSTPISGIPELVQHGVEGLLVPERDSLALAAAIERLLREPTLRARLARAARSRICESFDSHKTTARLRDLFLHAMRGQPAAW